MYMRCMLTFSHISRNLSPSATRKFNNTHTRIHVSRLNFSKYFVKQCHVYIETQIRTNCRLASQRKRSHLETITKTNWTLSIMVMSELSRMSTAFRHTQTSYEQPNHGFGVFSLSVFMVAVKLACRTCCSAPAGTAIKRAHD